MMPAGAVNAWVCEGCGEWTVVRHRDAGTTPFMIACRYCCSARALSVGYPDQDSIPESVIARIQWEWYKPSIGEFDELPKNVREHVKMGGLLLRYLE